MINPFDPGISYHRTKPFTVYFCRIKLYYYLCYKISPPNNFQILKLLIIVLVKCQYLSLEVECGDV